MGVPSIVILFISTFLLLLKDVDSFSSWIKRPDWLPSSWTPGGGGGIALAMGVIEISHKDNEPQCYKELNTSCFGQCLFKLQIQQTGPLHNLTSLAAPHYGIIKRKDCECPKGYGVYHANNRTATWYFTALRGDPAPRIMNVTIEHGNKVVLRHSKLADRTCPYIFDVTDGLVMGMQAKGGSTKSKRGFPLWAIILLAMGGVFLIAGMVFAIVGKRRRQAASSTSSSSSKKKKKQGGGGESEPTLRDPLLPTHYVRIKSEQTHGK